MTQTYSPTWYDPITGKKLGSNREWRDLRERKLEEQNYTCERCGVTQEQLHAIWLLITDDVSIAKFSMHVHHKDPNGARIVPLDQLEVNCPSCHAKQKLAA